MREGRAELPDETPEALFPRWLAEHGGAILKVARAYTLTAEDGRDLVQEILFSLRRSPPGLEDEAPGTA